MLFVRDAFGLPLEQAKKVLLEADGRSIEAWTEEIGNVIKELSSNLNDPDDTSKTWNHARSWLKKAAKQGHKKASASLKALERAMAG